MNTSAMATELLKHAAAIYRTGKGSEFWWECSCGHNFGQFLEGSSVPSGVTVIEWRLAEHRAAALAALPISAPIERLTSEEWETIYGDGPRAGCADGCCKRVTP